MTLIIGVLCKDGVVMGADGAATLGNIAGSTARQPVRKLYIVSTRAVVAVSGPVGMSQLFVDRVQKLIEESKLSGTHCKTTGDAMRVLSDAFKLDVHPAYESAKVSASVVGTQLASQFTLFQAVVALPVHKRPTLIQFDFKCFPEAASDSLPFLSIGSGEAIADPFLALIRRTLWPERLPNLAEGVFATVWTLKHTIATNTGGVADPKQVVVVTADGARELTVDELGEHEQNAQAAEEHLGAFKAGFSNEADEKAVPPPSPPR